MNELHFGQQINFTHKLTRGQETREMKTAGGYPYRALWKIWRKEEHLGSGIFLGVRTLQNGIREWEDEAGYCFTPKEFLKAALVCPNAKENPIYIPIDCIAQFDDCVE